MTTELPMTSVAEFRAAAWPLVNRNLPGSVSLDLYFTWGGLGGSAAVLGFGLAGLTVSPMSWWIVLVGAVWLALVVRRLRRKFREAREVRDRVDALSLEVDARAAAGLIPVAPPGWTHGVPDPPHARKGSFL